ncbi:MAG: transcription elongation factor GreA [Eubacterium sp.]|nr:transcription elongation factor GreA [Eubacterium sp.]
MAEEKKHLLTREGLKRLNDELHELEVHKRKEVRRKIAEARELGDLSENAEYDAAKDEQRDIEARIEQIKLILTNYEIIEDEGDGTVITTGCTVKIRDMELKEDEEYQIVGSTEANILEHRISNESPIGVALIGAKKGETVKVETPAGLLKYKVLSFSR